MEIFNVFDKFLKTGILEMVYKLNTEVISLHYFIALSMELT